MIFAFYCKRGQSNRTMLISRACLGDTDAMPCSDTLPNQSLYRIKDIWKYVVNENCITNIVLNWILPFVYNYTPNYNNTVVANNWQKFMMYFIHVEIMNIFSVYNTKMCSDIFGFLSKTSNKISNLVPFQIFWPNVGCQCRLAWMNFPLFQPLVKWFGGLWSLSVCTFISVCLSFLDLWQSICLELPFQGIWTAED